MPSPLGCHKRKDPYEYHSFTHGYDRWERRTGIVDLTLTSGNPKQIKFSVSHFSCTTSAHSHLRLCECNLLKFCFITKKTHARFYLNVKKSPRIRYLLCALARAQIWCKSSDGVWITCDTIQIEWLSNTCQQIESCISWVIDSISAIGFIRFPRNPPKQPGECLYTIYELEARCGEKIHLYHERRVCFRCCALDIAMITVLFIGIMSRKPGVSCVTW